MGSRTHQAVFIAAFVFGTLTSLPGLAEKPDWAGGPRADKAGQSDKRPAARRGDGGGIDIVVGVHFGDHHRSASRDYFRQHYSGASCPPGLAKKRNGCMPPGLAKKWILGQPLPRDTIFYDLPSALVIQLGAPPPGHRYVRVGADILLIAIGTGLVLDAIEDLGW